MASGSAARAAGGAWTLLGTATGSTPISLPASCSEFYAEVQYGSSTVHFAYALCRAQLGSSAKLYSTGYANGAQTTGFCQVSVSETEAYLLALLINGTSYTSSSTIRVYGR